MGSAEWMNGPRPDFGRIGLWTVLWKWPADRSAIAGIAAEVEQLGFSSLWIGGSPGGSARQFAVAEAALSATRAMTVICSIVDVWSTPADESRRHRRALASQYPGRFVLGLGAGHKEAIEPTTGLRYANPLSRVSAYLDELDAGEDPVPVSQRIVAALGPLMLRLAATRSLGAHCYEVTPDYVAKARSQLGPGPVIVPEQKLLAEADPATARRIGRERLAMHLTLENYRRSWRRLGMDDRDFTGGGSDRLVDTLISWGPLERVIRRVDDHFDAGADHVAVHILGGAANDRHPVEEWRKMAPFLVARQRAG